jgi:hypothetical protein
MRVYWKERWKKLDPHLSAFVAGLVASVRGANIKLVLCLPAFLFCLCMFALLPGFYVPFL